MRVILTAVARTLQESHAETMTAARARLFPPTIAIVTLTVLPTGCSATTTELTSS